MKPRRKRVLVLAVVLLATVTAVLAWRDGRCGRRVAAARMTNHAEEFDFRHPPCEASRRPEDSPVRIAYLGVGGLLIEWRGETIVSAPYYTRQGPFEALLGNVRVDGDAIATTQHHVRRARWS